MKLEGLTQNILMENARSVNIPLEEELESLLWVFWYKDRLPYMIELITKLEKLRISHKDTEIHEISLMKYEKIADLYLAGVVNDENLRNNFNKVIPSDLAASLVGSVSIKQKEQKNRVNTFANDLKNISLSHCEGDERKIFIAACIFMNFHKSVVQEKLKWSNLIYFLLLLLVYPEHLIACSSKYRKKFFSLFFKHAWETSWKDQIIDITSDLWKYIQKYFGELPELQKYIPNSQSTQEVTESTNLSARKVLEAQNIEWLPTIEEINKILPFFNITCKKEGIIMFQRILEKYRQNNKITPKKSVLGMTLEEITFSYISWGTDQSILQRNDIAWLDAISVRENSTGIEAMLLTSKKTGTLLQKTILKQIFKIFSVPRDYTDIRIDMLLLHPGYLLKATSEEQDRFFELFFKSQKWKAEILDKNSFIWKHLNKYFWDIAAVKSQYGTLISSDDAYKGWNLSKINITKNISQKEIALFLQSINSTDEIEKILSLNQKLYDFRVQAKKIAYSSSDAPDEHIPYFILNWIDVLQKESTEPEVNALEIYQNWDNYTPKSKRDIVKQILDSRLESGISDKAFYILILTKYSKWKPNQDFLSYFLESSRLLLCYPYFLIAATEDFQKKFFSIWFQALGKNNQLTDLDSNLWRFLRNNFGTIPTIQHKVEQIERRNKYKQKGKTTSRNTKTPNPPEKSINFSTVQIQTQAQVKIYPVEQEKISAEREDEICHVNSDYESIAWRYFHIVVWKKTNSWNLIDPYTQVELDLKDLHIKIWDGRKVLQIMRLSTDAKLNKASLSKHQGDLVTIPMKNLTQSTKKAESSPIIEELQHEDTPNYSVLEEYLLQVVWESVNIDENNIIFTPWGIQSEFLAENKLKHLDIKSGIICNDSWELLNFFGVENYKFVNPELQKHLDDICIDILEQREKEKNNKESLEQKQRREEEEKRIEKTKAKKIQQQKAIEQAIDDLGALPEKYIEARDFLKVCDNNDLYHSIKWEKYLAWTLPKGKSVLDSIVADIKVLWYNLEIGTSKLNMIHMLTIRNKQTSNSMWFHVSENPDYKNFNFDVSWDIDETQEWVIRYLLEHIIAILLKTGYNTYADKTKLDRINKELNERKSLREDTEKRLSDKTASFVEGWKEFESGKIGWDHEDINIYPILWRRWSINIGSGLKMHEDTRKEYFESTMDSMLSESSDALLEYFHKRLLITLDKIPSNGISAIRNTKAREIINSYSKELQQENDTEIKKDICKRVLNEIYDSWIPVYYIKPIDYSRRELKRK